MEVQQLADHSLDAMNTWVTEFHHFMTFSADDMVVLAVTVALLILSEVTAKLMLADEALLDKQIQGVVDRGAAYLQAALLHAGIKLFDIEVARTGIYFLQNGVPLAGFAQTFIFQVRGKKFFNFFELIGIQNALRGGTGRVLGGVTGF